MMLVRLDPEQGRDRGACRSRATSRSTIPGHGVDKINAAYSLGGPQLDGQTVQQPRSAAFPINHVVNVNFGGFRDAVERLGCVYVDVDRRYFNDNNPPAGGGGDYATIDVEPGYQKLCGLDALDYVRFRHLDNDFVRAARQQDFLRQAKAQVGVGRLFVRPRGARCGSSAATRRRTSTPSERDPAPAASWPTRPTKSPIREVRFPAGIENDTGGSYVTITEDNLQKTVHQFLEVRGSSGAGARKPTTTTPKTSGTSSSSAKKSEGVEAVSASPRSRPGSWRPDAGRGLRRGDRRRRRAAAGLLPRRPHRRAATPTSPPTRALYTIRDRARQRVQGVPDRRLAGDDRPVLRRRRARAGARRRSSTTRAGRSDARPQAPSYYDGTRLRLVAWRTDRGGLLGLEHAARSTLTNPQMLDIATVARPASADVVPG